MDLLKLRVVAIVPLATGTVTIYLERADGQPLEYRAGQFLTFLLVARRAGSGPELRRSYSFSSTPGIDAVAAITVKRVINVEVSRYLQDHLRVGDALVSLPVAGRFVLEETGASQVGLVRPGSGWLFFIAAGSGMTPIFSLLKEALVKKAGSKVVLITQFHDEESILFKESLEELTREYGGRLRWVSFLSSPTGRKVLLESGPPAAVEHRAGRLNNWWLEELMAELRGQSDLRFYLCGPPAFMRMVRFTLRVMGIEDERIKQEHFTVEYVPPPPLLTDVTPKKVMVQTGGRGHGAGGDVPVESRSYQFEVAWPATILQAALNQGIPLPYSCKGGRCSTCVAKCVSGRVKMSINEVLTEKDISEGLVLTCVGYAETDVALEF